MAHRHASHVPEFYAKTLFTAVPAGATSDFDVVLGPGHWFLTLLAQFNTQGSATTSVSVIPLDEAGNMLAEEGLSGISGGTVTSMTDAAGFILNDFSGSIACLINTGTGSSARIGLFSKLRVRFFLGTDTAGDVASLALIATRAL